jgi:DNA-binding NtrC family response regulator
VKREVRARLRSALTAQRWEVYEADGGAAALLLMERTHPHATLLDGPLPDLHLEDFADEVRSSHPTMDLIALDGALAGLPEAVRSPRRGELLQVLRSVCEEASSPLISDMGSSTRSAVVTIVPRPDAKLSPRSIPPASAVTEISMRLPELIGDSDRMLEVSRRIRLVAKRRTTVLIQGPTGTGKEVVAHALHRLSPRADRPFVALNCAAIPEALLEAELFGHARGAFTGAVQRRTGRIEAANGGTLFLDEIGEMPLALQSKLLRFLESGELQRVGENETVRVDVRIVAATHQPLARRAQEGSFRADLFYRLAVFRIHTPALAEHPDDLPALVEHLLRGAAGDEAAKQLSEEAFARLASHPWPGNVRELQHVLERASILAEDRPVITVDEIEFDLP